MIVCSCVNVNEKGIGHQVAEGATSLDDLKKCGIASHCGRCETFACKVLDSELMKSKLLQRKAS